MTMRGCSGSILVVEDSATQAHQLRLILEEAGYDVVVATNGAEGLREYFSRPAGGYALVLSDVVMPEVSGYELCRQIKGRGDGPAAVILLTALEKPTDIMHGLACGADNFIRKPFDPVYLLERVRRVLSLPRPDRAGGGEGLAAIRTSFMGEEIAIHSGREQILEFLLSTFADFVRANERQKRVEAVESAQRAELERAREREEYVRKEKEALDESRRFLEQTLNALTAQVAILDDRGVIVGVNESWRRLAGSSGAAAGDFAAGADYLNARGKVEGGSEEPGGELERAIRQVTTGQREVVEGEYAVASPGATRWFSIHVSRFAGKGPVRVVVAHEDITDQRSSRELLRRQAADLAQSNADLEKFAYVASHDLQEPLRVVAGYMQLFEERCRGKIDPEADRLIERVLAAVRRMKTLIEDLLAYSRVGTRATRLAEVDCHGVVMEAVEDLRVAIDEAQANISVGPLPTVMGDAGQLRELFENLLSNAVKYRSSRAPDVRVTAKREGNLWRISVSDNGIGIDKQYWERIFVVFQRLHTARDYPGNGIGLAICKRIVERHGGSLSLESNPGQGSTFSFSIPAMRENREVADADRAA